MQSEEIGIVSNSVRRDLGELRPLSTKRCIYRVPNRFLEINEKAYKPKLVSIGPFHHGKEELKAMEDFKNRYLEEFLQHSNNADVDQYIGVILQKEKELRDYYAESITLSTREFVKMMLVDAAFLLMLMLKYSGRFGGDDRIFAQPWMIYEVRFDILLLENQLPYFILVELLTRFYTLGNEGVSVMNKLTHHFLKSDLSLLVKEDALEKHDFREVKHFVDFLRICLLPAGAEAGGVGWGLTTPLPASGHANRRTFQLSQPLSPSVSAPLSSPFSPSPAQIPQPSVSAPPSHRFRLRQCLPVSKTTLKLKKISVPSVTKLRQSGVKYKLSSSDNIFDIKFNDGILEIPSLRIEDKTEILFRNLQAFEQCHYDIASRYLSCYISIMSMLINAAEDVEILAKKGIIENWLRNNEAAFCVFYNLSKGNAINKRHDYFSYLVEDLKTYRASLCQRSWAALKHTFFDTPWAGISALLAATILLILSIIQTVCSIIKVVQ